MKKSVALLSLFLIIAPFVVTAQGFQRPPFEGQVPIHTPQSGEGGFDSRNPGGPGSDVGTPPPVPRVSGETSGSGSITGESTGSGLRNPLKFSSISEFFVGLIKVLVRLGSIVVVIMLMIVGFMFVVARGNPEKIKTARTALLWTLVGAVLLLGAEVIATAISATINSISAP